MIRWLIYDTLIIIILNKTPSSAFCWQQNPLYCPERCCAFQCDLTKDDMRENVPEGSVDVVTLIFVLSAIHPDKMKLALQNISRVRAESAWGRETQCRAPFGKTSLIWSFLTNNVGSFFSSLLLKYTMPYIHTLMWLLDVLHVSGGNFPSGFWITSCSKWCKVTYMWL